MGVIDFAQYVNQAIQAGEIVEGNVVKIVADNGAKIGEGVFKVIEGGNGTAAEVGIATQTGASGTVATGLAYLFLDVGVVGTALAPALGFAAGVGLYSMAPDFWNSVTNAITDAGLTVAGKVLCYWDGENVFFDAKTIEIFKNELLAANAYGSHSYITDEDFPDIPDLHNGIGSSAPVAFVNYGYSEPVRDSQGHIITYRWETGTLSTSSAVGAEAMSGCLSGDLPGYVSYRYIAASSDPAFSPFSYIHNGKIVYYKAGSSYLSSHSVDSITGPMGITNDLWNRYTSETAWVMIYGTEYENPDIDPTAIKPSEEEFPLSYPDWIKKPVPETIPNPSEFPEIYPIKYPGIGEDPSQDPAQNPGIEPAPDIYPVIMPDFPLPNPTPEPEPEPTPDPDPQPEPDPLPDSPANPGPDPADPNIPPTPSVPIIVPPLPDTVNSNKLFTVYNPSSSQLDALGGYLWDSSIIAAIRDIWQEPMDGLISLQQVYVTPVTGSAHNIILGFLDSGVTSPVVTQQFVEVNCGSVTVPENKKNATDYAPYTSLHLYLPFIGIVELDTNECMNSTISVKYKVDVYTGTCLATISVDREEDMPNDPILYTYSGNCSQQLPLTSGNATGMLSALVGAVTAGISVASGGGLSTLAGAQLLGNSLTHDMMHVSHSGNISANAGIMGQKKPYLIIGRRHCYDANNYNAYYGFPANKAVVLGNHTGFCRVKSAWIKTSALQEEYNQIMELLEDGVFI